MENVKNTISEDAPRPLYKLAPAPLVQPTEVRSRDRHQTVLPYLSRKPASLVWLDHVNKTSSFHLVHLINPFSIKIKIDTQWLKNTLKDQSPFEYLQTNRGCIDGKDKTLYASIISKCLNLNNREIPITPVT